MLLELELEVNEIPLLTIELKWNGKSDGNWKFLFEDDPLYEYSYITRSKFISFFFTLSN